MGVKQGGGKRAASHLPCVLCAPCQPASHQSLCNGTVNQVVCLAEVLHHHSCARDLCKHAPLLAQVRQPDGVVDGVVGGKVVAVGAAWWGGSCRPSWHEGSRQHRDDTARVLAMHAQAPF